MLFNSLEFIFVFLPLVWAVYFLLLYKGLNYVSKVWLVICSLFFYSWWNILYLPLILVSLAINFAIGTILINIKENNRKVILVCGVGFNLLLLGYFKYSDFFIETINTFTGNDFSLLNLVLPLAISFFTFQQIAFLIDAFQRKTNKIQLIDYMLFILFFPQLIAGPIVQHYEMIPQFKETQNRLISYKNIALGCFVFMIGIFKKVVIADTLSIWANQGFQNTDSLSFVESWLTTLSYTFQLYFDFSGYSDMAIGIGLLFNIKIPINFLSPYRSLNIQEFWRRWHITLGRFFTQYVYIPLGGNRKGNIHTYLNLFIVFLLSGIWHGAGWNFIIWGSLHGIAILIHRSWKMVKIPLPNPLAWIFTFLFVHFAWIFFRANTIDDALVVVKAMFGLSDSYWSFHFNSAGNVLLELGKFVTSTHANSISILFIFWGLFFTTWFMPNTIWYKENFKPNLLSSILFALMLLVTLYISFDAQINSEFLYFNF